MKVNETQPEWRHCNGYQIAKNFSSNSSGIVEQFSNVTLSERPWDGKTVEITGFTEKIENEELQLIYEDKDLSGLLEQICF